MTQNLENQIIYFRLIALWVIVEAFIGGIIHAAKLPISGLVVGAGALVCLSMIAFYVDEKMAIIKATIIVAVFKLMLSPQSPLPAYLAVFFQGACAQILLSNKKYFQIKCILLGLLCFVESGIQRVLVMTIIYGKDVWFAIDSFIQNITQQKAITEYSYMLISFYVLAHLVTGIFIGLFIGKLPTKMKKFDDSKYQFSKNETTNIDDTKKQKNIPWFYILLWLIMVLLLVSIHFNFIETSKLSNKILNIILRSFIIVLSWKLLIAPFIKSILIKWLSKKQTQHKETIENITIILPQIQTIVNLSWQFSKQKNILKRLNMFCLLVLKRTINTAKIETSLHYN